MQSASGLVTILWSAPRGLPPDPEDAGVLDAFAGLARKHFGLSLRPAECLYHLLRGVTNNGEVARAMGLSYQTVKNHWIVIHKHPDLYTRERAILRAWPLYTRARRLAATIAPVVMTGPRVQCVGGR